MAEHTLPTPAAPARNERGLSYALMGGIGITLLALLVGGALLSWKLFAQQMPPPAALLPADTQVYLGLAPTLSDVPDLARLGGTLRDNLGITDAAALRGGIESRLGADYTADIAGWLGSGMALAVRGVAPEALQSGDPLEQIMAQGQVLIMLPSRNDPQARAFLQKHLSMRETSGERIAQVQAGDATVYVSEGAAASPLRAFGLVRHYIVFSNQADAIIGMATQAVGDADSLAALPAFASFSQGLSPSANGALYSDGSPDQAAIRSALRTLILRLGE